MGLKLKVRSSGAVLKLVICLSNLVVFYTYIIYIYLELADKTLPYKNCSLF